jgi:HK97 family phage major capsid protein
VIIKKDQTMTEVTPATAPPPPPVQIDDVLKAERSRIADITAIGAKFNMRDLADLAIGKGLSADQFRHDVLMKLGDSRDQVLRNQNSMGLSKTEAQDFSFLKVIRALANPQDRAMRDAARFELDVSAAYAQKTGQATRGLLVPPDVIEAEASPALKRALMPYMKRDLTVGTASAAGYLVSTDTLTGSFIELLRAAMVLQDAGVTTLGNLQGNLAIPRQTGAGTAYWITSEGGSPTESQQAVGQVNMSPKTVGAFTDITRQFLLQSSVDAEAFVRADFARIMGLKIDAAGLLGAGAAGEPQGIKNTTGIGTQSIASSGDPTFAEVVAMEGTVDAANALAGSLAYIAHPTMVAKMKVKSVVTGQAIFVWGGDNRVNSYRGLRTTQIAATELFLGNWADLVMAMWGGLDITVDPYTQSTAGTVRIVALQSVDFGVRHVESFVRAA